MPDFPTLTLVAIDRLLTHEQHDSQCTRSLIPRLRVSGVLRDPPVITPLPGDAGRFMVLEGTNRVAAIKEMGIPHVLVQVVSPDDSSLDIQSWNHVIWEMNTGHFLEELRKIPGLQLRPQTASDAQPGLTGDLGLALVQDYAGRAYMAYTQSRRQDQRVHLLNAIVDSYRDRSRFDPTSARHIHPLLETYPTLHGLVIFPDFTIEDLLELAGRGYLLPASIIRFTISPRALHLNYPLEELAAEKPLEAKISALHEWIQDRITRRGVRYYSESTYLFNE